MNSPKNVPDENSAAIVTTAVPLSGAQLGKLEKLLESRFNKRVVLQNVTDKDVLGGFNIRYGDWYLDATLSSDLNNLKDLLI